MGNGEWIKCSDRLPEVQHYFQLDMELDISDWVLGYCMEHNLIEVVRYTKDFFGDSWCSFEGTLLEITHWQLLPDAPEVEG